MESHKPILSTNELKTLCKKVSKENITPLVQAQEAIKVITALRLETKNTEISVAEWQNLPDNKIYMNIAENYLSKKAALRKQRKEEKDKYKRFN